MREPDRDITEELSRDELMAVLAWVIDHYCGTGVVEIDLRDASMALLIERETYLVQIEITGV